MTNSFILGCIGDDFTGSSDAASFLVNAGMKTVLLNGIQQELPDISCDAIVVALKTRSMEKSAAVKQSLAVLEWLEQKGARHFYIKYCSTFDSTKEGNIGPIIDAALKRYREPYTVLCPALPVNKRIVKDGALWVDGILLADGPMRHHPLNPMWASDLAELMKPQGKYPSLKIPHSMLEEKTIEEIQDYIADFAKSTDHFYVIPDYMNEDHAQKIAHLFAGLKIMTGGSGILSALGATYRDHPVQPAEALSGGVTGRGIILAGSCSTATLEQIEAFRQSGGVSFKINPLDLLNGQVSLEDIWAFVAEHAADDVLVYSSETPDAIRRNQQYGREKMAKLLEDTLAALGKRACGEGFKRIIVAGGETSGAVTLALGFHAFLIGESIAPGVPMMMPLQRQDMRIVLKSGNFGEREFFRNALNKTKG